MKFTNTHSTLLLACITCMLGATRTQDTLIQNRFLKTGSYDCEAEYQALKQMLPEYQRPLTTLEIGNKQGYYSFRLAQDFDTTAIFISPDNNDYLLNLCTLNENSTKSMLLKTKMDTTKLTLLTECETFDVVLVLDVMETFGVSWQEAIDIIISLGDTVIIEVEPEDYYYPDDDIIIEVDIVYDYLRKKGGTVINNTNLVLFKRSKLYLHKPYWNADTTLPLGESFIEVTATKKLYHDFTTDKHTPMKPGINQKTFEALNGVYP